MKCPKCRHDMRKQKIDEGKYRYVCPVCFLIIGGNNETNNSVSGNDEPAPAESE